jgi:CelD/BcsL family acetyltransferase involved in cellulose biosynthesis
MHFERLALNQLDWTELDRFGDRTLQQSRGWLAFLQATQSVELVVAALREDGQTLGYFTGGIVRKFGLRMLGSPFPGWTTSYMGFNLAPGIAREAALAALVPFAFNELKCLHLEIMDRQLERATAEQLGFAWSSYKGYEVDLARPEEQLLASFKDDCRWRIRKAAKSGVLIEEATDADFAAEYYAQLIEVFAKRGVTPTYDQQRVRALVENLLPTGNLLLLRARDQTGQCIATGIFPALNDTAYYWGGASWRAAQALSPNEAIQWYAMRYWKARGMTKYDMCGGGAYKAKYCGQVIDVPWLRRSKYEFLAQQRDRAKRVFWFAKKFSGVRRPQ